MKLRITLIIILLSNGFNLLFGQTTIATDGFNNTSTLFTLTNGAYYTGTTAAADRPSGAAYAIEGTHSRGAKNATATLLSNNIDASNYNSISMSLKLATFSINAANNGADSADIVTVEVSPNGGSTWYSTVRVLGNNNAYWDFNATGIATTAYDGNATPVDFTPAGGGSRTTDGYSTITITGLPSVSLLKFRITLLNNHNSELWLVDDFKVQGNLINPCSGFPANSTTISTSNTQCSGTNFTLSLGTIYLDSGITYQWQSATDNAFTTNVTNLGTASTQTTSQNSTKYYRCAISCGGNTTYSSILMVSNTLCYCASTATSSTAYFTSFTTTGGTTNITNNNSGYSTNGYGDFTSSQTVTQFQNGTINFSALINGIAGGVGVAIFVDWNQNGTFTDAGETVYNSASYLYANPSGSFVVPNTAMIGTTRMRIVSNYFATNPLSCNTSITGETEDYTLIVTALPCAGNPSNIVVTINSQTSSTINWTAANPTPANGYQYYLTTSNVSPNNATTPTGTIPTGTTSITLTGLVPATTYYFWIRSNCGGGLGTGVWMNSPSFYQPSCAIGNGSGTTTLGCPSVTSGGLGLSGADPAPINDCTSGACVNLEATYLKLGQTTNYTVQSIPYNPPYQFNCLRNPVSVNVDDIWSPVINLPFNFCFYGTNYNKCLIGSNGVLTFDTTNNVPGGWNEWSFANNLPSTSLFLNTIFGVYHDIDPSKGGEVGWELITLNTGCRALVASWNNIPMFSTTCNSQLYTGMIVLYENTNIIEVYIKEKNVCGTWNDGNAIVGIQNASGNQAVVAPNRNGLDTNWTVTNEAWRFVPSGTSITSIKWYEGTSATGNVVGTTDVINVCPSRTTTYTAEVSYSLCNGTILKESDTTTVTVVGSKVWNGSIDTDWDKPMNWTPNTAIPNATDCVIIPITPNNPIISGNGYNGLAGTLSVLNGATLTVNCNNNITVTNWVNVENTGTFIIQNDASLIQINNVANVGNIIYKRNALIRNLDYVYWSSPVANFNVNNIAAPLTLGPIYKWNPTVANPNGGQGNWENAIGNTMIAAKGYIARGPSSFSSTIPSLLNGTFIGVPNNGPISFTISRGSDTNTNYHIGNNGTEINNFSDNWNLLGNPYPSAIRGSQFLFDNKNKIEGNIKLWTHGTLPSQIASPFYNTFAYNYNPGDYLTYNFTGTSCCPNANADLFVAGGQGFFVQMKDGAAGSDTVTFNNNLRNYTFNNNLFYRGINGSSNNGNIDVNNIERNRVWLDLIDSSNLSDRTLFGYIEGATMKRDNFFDCETLDTGSMAIYSMIDEDKYVIQGRKLPFSINDEVPLGIHIRNEGNYSIAIAATDGFLNTQNIYIEDDLLNITHDLKSAPYHFYSPAGTINDRFKIVYIDERKPNHKLNNRSESLEIITNKNITIYSNELIDTIIIYDAIGRELQNFKDVNNSELTISNLLKTNSTLLFRIKLQNGNIINKKVIF